MLKLTVLRFSYSLWRAGEKSKLMRLQSSPTREGPALSGKELSSLATCTQTSQSGLHVAAESHRDVVLMRQTNTFSHPPKLRGLVGKFFLPGIHAHVLFRTSWWRQNVPAGVGGGAGGLQLPIGCAYDTLIPGKESLLSLLLPKINIDYPRYQPWTVIPEFPGLQAYESARPTINKPAAISVIYWSPGILVSVNLQDSSYFWAVRQNRVSGGLLAGFELSLYHFLWHSLSLG